MKTQYIELQTRYIELLQSIRTESYKLGFFDGKEQAKEEHNRKNEMLQNELHLAQKRAQWLQDKLIRTKENYEGQINNLQNKIKHYEDIKGETNI